MKKILLLLAVLPALCACKKDATPGAVYDDVDFVYVVPYDPDPEAEALLEVQEAAIYGVFLKTDDEDKKIGFRLKAGGYFRDYPREVKFRVEPSPANPDAKASDYFHIDYSNPYIIPANEGSVVVPVVCYNQPEKFMDMKGKDLIWYVVVETNDYFEAIYYPNRISIVVRINEKYREPI